jgi:hypothetical protein
MPQPTNLAKAELREIRWTNDQLVEEINPEQTVQVQFNPESLKVSFANQNAGGDQRGGSAVQFVGAGTTKLSMQLWFDSALPLPDGNMAEQGDVRKLTEKVVYFIKPQPVEGEDRWRPAGVRFLWGTFKFDGVVNSMDETLEYFSEDGVPLRASVSLNISSQMIQFQFGDQQATRTEGNNGSPGQQPLVTTQEGDSAPQVAARTTGDPNEWQPMARGNNIERPHQIPAGTMINPNLRG